jgi:hypothetical protein
MSSITITGLEALRVTLRNVASLDTKVIDDMAEIAFNTMRAGAGRHSPRPQGTGRLYASMFREGAGTLRQVVGHDLNAAPHAMFVVFPTRPHEIRPRKPGGVLAWRANGGGGPWVFRRRVWHPGYAGDNYRDEAEAAALSRMRQIVDTNFGRV